MAAAIFGPKRLYLDHLAPLAALLQIPLIVTDEEIATLTKQFYPDVELQFYEGLTGTTQIVQEFDLLITTLSNKLLKRLLFFPCQTLKKEPKMVWLPHGNSDKGRKKPLMEALGSEEMILVYGQKMIDFIKEKGVLDQIPHVLQVGNYRYEYYKKHKEFYDSLTQSTIAFPEKKKTILYAPTWEDFESSGTLFGPGIKAIESLEDFNLIVKLHPNTTREKPAELLQLKERFKNQSVLFLEAFPPIYPLCNLANIYLGDMSSIGYDFLTFSKPMFFLNEDDYPLQKCGTLFHPKELKTAQCAIAKQKLYSHTFAKTPNFNKLKSSILGAWENGKSLQKS